MLKLKNLLFESHIIIKTDCIDEVRANLLTEFLIYATGLLRLKNICPVELVDVNEIPTTTAYYDPEKKVVRVAVKGRALPDYLRSIGHELTHRKQDEDGSLHDKSGLTGSKHENQANSMAGILLRNFSKQHPEIYTLE